MATFYLQHVGKGKAKYNRQGIIDHGRYILRRSARGLVEARHAPTDYGQVLGWLGRIYDESRANARVIDSIIVNLPRELDQVASASLLRTYLNTITEGRTPYLFVIHTDKPENPHAHIVIRDADLRSGRRVAGLSKLGSSHRLRALWEALCNTALRDHGIAVSRHGKSSAEFQRLNQEAHARMVNASDETKDRQMPPPLHASNEVKSEIRPLLVKEFPMADVIQFPDQQRSGTPTVEYNLPDIQSVLTTDAELTRLRAVKAQLTQLKADYTTTQAQLDSTIKRMGDLANNVTKLTAAHSAAAQTYAEYRRWGFLLKGFTIAGWKSPTRIRAERARENYNVATDVLDHTSKRLEAVRKEHRILQTLAKKMEQSESLIRDADLTYGNDADLRDADVILRNTLHMYSERVNEVHVQASLANKDITTDEANRLRRVIARRQEWEGYAR